MCLTPTAIRRRSSIATTTRSPTLTDANDNLTSITDANSLATTFTYTSGLLSGITDPASRTTSFSHNANDQLTGITEPGSAAWSFSYDTDGHLTGRTDPLSESITFSYGSADRISGVTRADATTDSLTPYQTKGFLAAGSGTSASPGAAVLLAGAVRTYTDGRSNDWEARYDWTGFGKTMGDLDARGYLWVTHRDEGRTRVDVHRFTGSQLTLLSRWQRECDHKSPCGLQLRHVHLQFVQPGDAAYGCRQQDLQLHL